MAANSCSSSQTGAPGMGPSPEAHTKSDAQAPAAQPSPQPTAHCTAQPTVIPALLLGDVFAPCNALGLFQQHGDLDELFGHMGGMASTGHVDKSACRSFSHQATSAAGTHGQDGVPSHMPSFEEGVSNLRAGRHRLHKQAAFRKRPKARASDGVDTHEAGLPGAMSNSLVWSIDPSVQLLLRTVSAVNGRRLFFVSPRAADTIREAIVLDRHKALQDQKAAQQAVLSPLGGLAAHSGGLGRVTAWWGGMEDWLRAPQGPASVTPASSGSGSSQAAASTAVPAVASAPADTPGGDGRSPEAPVPPHVPAPHRALSAGDPLIKGPQQVIPLVAQLVDAATQLGPAFDWRALEERCVAAEAANIRAGGRERPHIVEGPASFVGRVPLQAALSLVSASPDQFGCVVTGTDTRLVHEARGRKALMDVRAATQERWVLKVEDDDSEEDSDSQEEKEREASGMGTASGPATRGGAAAQAPPAHARRRPRPPGAAHGSEADDEHDDDMALTSLTPVFRVPGVTLSLRTAGGQRVALAPAFLSITQLHVFLQASKAVVRSMWLSGRKAQRAAFTRKLEGAALALSGLGGGSSGLAGGSGAAVVAPPDDEEDEDGLGEPPEAKALLAELGEGRRPAGAGGGWAGGGGGPLTGWPALVSTLAVGVVSAVAHVAAVTGNVLDHVTAHSPMAMKAMGFPAHVAVSADYLESCLQSLAVENAGRSSAWQAKRRHSLLAKHGSKTLTPLSPDASTALPTTTTPASERDTHTTDTLHGSQRQDGKAVGKEGAQGGAGGLQTGQGKATEEEGAEHRPINETPSEQEVLPHPKSTSSWSTGTSLSVSPGNGVPADSTGAATTSSKVQRTASEVVAASAADISNRAKHRKAGGGVGGGGPSSAGPTQQLESLAGVSMLLQAVWAVLHDAHKGDAQLASALAASWASQAKVLAAADGELSVMMNVQLRPHLVQPTSGTLGSSPAAQAAPGTKASGQQQPNAAHPGAPVGTTGRLAGTLPEQGSDGGLSAGAREGQQAHPDHSGGQRIAASVHGDHSLAALMALSVPPHVAAEAQAHKFEVGLHINAHKLVGDVPPGAADTASMDQTCLKGLLLVGDLGLERDEEAGALEPATAWRAPPLGYMDLAHLLAAHQRQEAERKRGQEAN